MVKFAERKSMETNIYRRARYKAAENKKSLGDLGYAARELGLTDSPLSRYENDQIIPSAETVVSMSLLYGNPNLRREHCCTKCAIGRVDVKSANLNDLMASGYIVPYNIIENNKFLDDLRTCMKDGRLDAMEMRMLSDKHLASVYETIKLWQDIACELERGHHV